MLNERLWVCLKSKTATPSLQVFIAVWKAVIQEGKYLKNDWTVKAGPSLQNAFGKQYTIIILILIMMI